MFGLEQNSEDIARLGKKFDDMLRKIDHFGKVELGQVMSDWQTQDMHRHRPFTLRWRRKVQTTVRPHSLREVLGKRRYMRKVLGLKLKRAPRRHRTYYRWSTRPILRAALEQKLMQDMIEAFQRAITWKD